MSEPFVGEIRMFAGNFAPRGWAFCDGQLLPISENDTLFSLLGTLYAVTGRPPSACRICVGGCRCMPARAPVSARAPWLPASASKG